MPAIMVTSQKIEQRLIEVPVSITYIDGQGLKDAQIETVEDLTSRIAGVMPRNFANADAHTIINVRGIVSGGPDFFSRPVGIFQDGVSINGGFEPMFYEKYLLSYVGGIYLMIIESYRDLPCNGLVLNV